MCNAKRKWHCPRCSRDSSRHWNMKVHIKRKHSGVGEPIDEAKEFKEKRGHQFFSYNQSYGMNDLSMGNQLGKEKEPDIIDVMYQVVMEEKEKFRKIMEIKGFLNELSSLSSSAQPHITTGLSQTPIIEPKSHRQLQQIHCSQHHQYQHQQYHHKNKKSRILNH